MQTAAFLEYLEREKQDILDHCTQCGTCVEVCPMPQYDPAIAQTDPVLVVGKVLELLRTGVASPEAKTWALSCSNSGRCIPACPEGVNPRKMLALARLELRRQQTASNPQAAQRFSHASTIAAMLSRPYGKQKCYNGCYRAMLWTA